MKSAKPTNPKKINLKPKDLTPNKDPRGGAKKFSRPRPDGLSSNHNEMFLADLS
jgi:tetratricopeptide (TPR) repeat protein